MKAPPRTSRRRASPPLEVWPQFRRSAPRIRCAMTVAIFAAVEAFILEHEYCGELNSGVEDERVWMTCTCGAVINRNADRD
jgi:hypothetical protein